jgi:hypothetical protein
VTGDRAVEAVFPGLQFGLQRGLVARPDQWGLLLDAAALDLQIVVDLPRIDDLEAEPARLERVTSTEVDGELLLGRAHGLSAALSLDCPGRWRLALFRGGLLRRLLGRLGPGMLLVGRGDQHNRACQHENRGARDDRPRGSPAGREVLTRKADRREHHGEHDHCDSEDVISGHTGARGYQPRAP